MLRYDHATVIGRVRAARARAGVYPLVYLQGDYRPFKHAVEERLNKTQ
jgi:hypothetical protein